MPAKGQDRALCPQAIMDRVRLQKFAGLPVLLKGQGVGVFEVDTHLLPPTSRTNVWQVQIWAPLACLPRETCRPRRGRKLNCTKWVVFRSILSRNNICFYHNKAQADAEAGAYTWVGPNGEESPYLVFAFLKITAAYVPPHSCQLFTPENASEMKHIQLLSSVAYE